MDVGQSEVAALIRVRQSFVVDAQQVQNRGLQIVNVDSIFGDVDAVVVGPPPGHAALNASTSHPHGKTAWVMIAAVVCFRQAALRVDRPTELAAPDNQRVIEHASLLEIPNQAGRRLVGVSALRSDLLRQVAVLIPASMEELYEPHASFG